MIRLIHRYLSLAVLALWLVHWKHAPDADLKALRALFRPR